MARRPTDDGSTSMKLSEYIVMAIFLVGAVAGVRWYMNYRHSPSYVLSQFFDEVKAGNVPLQYELIDDEDKKNFFATQADYDKSQNLPLAHGYVERIVSVDQQPPVADPKNPDIAKVTAKVSVRASGEGKQVYETGASTSYTDTYTMRRNSEGAWKIWFSRSGNRGSLNLLQAKPSPNSSY